jgi:hypothetical protein
VLCDNQSIKRASVTKVFNEKPLYSDNPIDRLSLPVDGATGKPT